jgi:hypothetical protein
LGAAQINAFLFCFLPTGLGVAQINALFILLVPAFVFHSIIVASQALHPHYIIALQFH